MSCGNSGRSDDEDQRQTYYAISNYTAVEDSQLSLSEGDVVDVLEKVNETWWWAEVEGETGYVPTNHLSETCPSEGVDRWQDVEYFSSYNTLKLHLEMLSDKPRTLAYRTAFETARAFIQGKVVLDLGCGTGILSVFSACLGDSRKVYAVEASDICEQAERVISHNSLSEKVSVIQTKAEDLELPEKVDLIVSEWMGTMLLFELMIESVLVARDKWLKPDGVMWPSEACLYLAPCSAHSVYNEKVMFWNDVYGFDFSPLIPVTQAEILGHPLHNHVLPEDDCLSPPATVARLLLKTATLEDIEKITSSFKFKITKDGEFHGFRVMV
ncbi:Protein arginine N-methyltransferase 2 [Geodia barretti]|uniref:Protein arginine N-methyltransferase 2 n=1 Tax=Geodia barretti TaxID=519541 RepID=A0AA35U275_GEOBA|nr:Protein arginine N-methyltransferase 2 [Geodia barretti]